MFKKKLSLLALPLVAAVSLQAQNPFDDPFFNDPFGDDIFKEMIQMQQRMDEMFKRMQQRMHQRSTRLVSPLGTYKLAAQSQFVDKGDHYEMITNIPQSKENHIDINTADGMLSITAKIVHEKESKENGMVSTSRSVQMYQQSTSLPTDADESGIKSHFVDGKLVIEIPKKKAAKLTPKQTVPATSTPSKPAAAKLTPKKEVVDLPKVDKALKQKVDPKESPKGEKKEHTTLNDRTSMS